MNLKKEIPTGALYSLSSSAKISLVSLLTAFRWYLGSFLALSSSEKVRMGRVSASR
jgi:hypothetical protein